MIHTAAGLPEYDVASTVVRELASPDEPNMAVREFADIVTCVMDLRDCAVRASSYLSVTQPGYQPSLYSHRWSPQNSVSAAVWRLLRTTARQISNDDWVSLRTVSSYEELRLPVMPSLEASDWLCWRLPDKDPVDAGSDDWALTPPRIELLELAVRLSSAMLPVVRQAMGPRSESSVRTLADVMGGVPKMISRLQHSVLSYLAFPSAENTETVRGRQKALSDSLPFPPSDKYSPIYDRQGVVAVGNVYGPDFPATPFMRKLARTGQRRVGWADQVLRGGPPAEPVIHSIDKDWSGPSRQHASKTLWHLARSRRGRALWS